MSKIEAQPQLAVFWVIAHPEQPEVMERLNAAIEAQRLVPGVLALDHGPRAADADWEGPDKAFNYGMIMTFDSFEAGRAWVPDPVHQHLVDVILSSGSGADDIRAFWIGQ